MTDPNATMPMAQSEICAELLPDVFERHRQRLGLLGCELRFEISVRDQAGEYGGDHRIKDRADDERSDYADRQIALRVFGLFGDRRNGVKSDVSEKDYGRARADARKPVRVERMPVRRLNISEAHDDEESEHQNLDADHRGIEPGALFDAPDQNYRYKRDDKDGQQVEDYGDAEYVRGVSVNGLHAVLRQRSSRRCDSPSRSNRGYESRSEQFPEYGVPPQES